MEGRKGVNGWRLPAEEIESLVIRQMDLVLRNRKLLSEWIVEHASHAKILDGLQRAKAISTTLASALPIDKLRLVRAVIHRIVVAPNKVVFEINPGAVVN